MPIQLPTAPAQRPEAPARAPHWANVELRLPERLLGARFGDKRKADLYRELHVLIASGVDPGTVLRVLADARKDAQGKALFTGLQRSLAQGRTLAGAFAAHGSFSRYEEQSVQVGEETGRLPAVLAELAEHYEAKVKLRRMLTSAFAYPGFVLFISGGVVAFMLRVVVPMFSDVFRRSGAELPAITKMVVRLSGAAGPALLLAAAVALGLVAGYAAFKRRPAVQQALAWVLVRLPLVGAIHHKAQFARFYRAMASMLAAQLPLDRALGLAGELIDLYTLRQAVADIREQVMRGVPLHAACGAHALFDARDVAMIAVAEEVRQLDRMFLRLAEQRTAEVQHRTGLMGSVLEPVMIVFIAVFVGTILVAMYLPMFKLSSAF